MQELALSSFNEDTTINPFNHFSFTFKAGSQGNDIQSKIIITESKELGSLSPDMQDKLYHLTMKCFLEESFKRYMEESGTEMSAYMESIFSYLINLEDKKSIN